MTFTVALCSIFELNAAEVNRSDIRKPNKS